MLQLERVAPLSRPAAVNLVDLLRERAEVEGSRVAFIFLSGQEGTERPVTYAELDQKARAIAVLLSSRFIPGDRLLLICPPGQAYVEAFFGCVYAGCVPVPAYPPRNERHLTRIKSMVEDAGVSGIVGTASEMTKLAALARAGLEHFPRVAVDRVAPVAEDAWSAPPLAADDQPVFLQYTSGSTGSPKGVMVGNRGIFHNLEMISTAFQCDRDSVGVVWLPPYHDMGLIGGILVPIYQGFPCVSMPPEIVVQQPLRWLAAISHYRGTISGGPNFAFQLCLRKVSPEQRKSLDLSCWKIAFTGAEPVRDETLSAFTEAFRQHGFDSESFFPCYGLAESTLMVTSRTPGRPLHRLRIERAALSKNRIQLTDSPRDSQLLVSCGRALGGQTVLVSEPEFKRPLAEGQVGEVRVSGPSIALGYWGNSAATTHTFQSAVEGEGSKSFLRTGDLGFFQDGELYITGRLKDLIIISGRNYYSQDIESTVARSHPILAKGSCAAFGISSEDDEKLVVVAELDRHGRPEDLTPLYHGICEQVGREHELSVHSVSFVGPARIPKTSSGKLQRSLCRDRWTQGLLEEIARFSAGSPPRPAQTQTNPSSFPSRLAESPSSTPTVDQLIGWIRSYSETRINSRLIDERRCIPPHIVLDFGRKGLLGMQIPRQYGGLGLGTGDAMRIMEQLSAIDLTLAFFVGLNNSLGIRPILSSASEELKKEILPDLAAGRMLAAFALTERAAGSSPRGITTTATKAADGSWLLNGTKVWSGSAAWAGVINVFAKNVGSPGMTAFLVRQETPGVEMGPEELTMGVRGMVQNSVILHDARITPGDVLGKVGSGMEVAQETMTYARLGFGAIGVGGMKKCAQLLLRYAERRTIITGPLINNPVTAAVLYEITCRIASLDTLVGRACAAIDAERTVPVDVFIVCKILGAEFLWTTVDELVQALGGRGYIETNLIPQLLRDARLMRIFEGPTEALNQHLGSRAFHASADLHRFLRQEWDAGALSEQIQETVADLQEACNVGVDTLGGAAAANQWAYTLSGEIVQEALLLAATEKALALQPSEHLSTAAAWARRRYENALARAKDPIGPQAHFAVDGMKAQIVAYTATIGDLEPRAAPELQAIDPYLLRATLDPARAESSRPLSVREISAEPLAPAPPEPSKLDELRLRVWLTQWVSRHLRIEESSVQPETPLAALGIDSMLAVELMMSLETEYGLRLDATAAWDYPNISALALHLAKLIGQQK